MLSDALGVSPRQLRTFVTLGMTLSSDHSTFAVSRDTTVRCWMKEFVDILPNIRDEVRDDLHDVPMCIILRPSSHLDDFRSDLRDGFIDDLFWDSF